ncbi:MAG: sulfatase-like hydrolase/transferase, partial [Thermomicrobiales bacterium]
MGTRDMGNGAKREQGMGMADRRRFLAGGAGAVASIFAGGAGVSAKKQSKKQKPAKPTEDPTVDSRPNIVMILTDDMRGTDWRALKRTKKALRTGTWFPNFIVDASLCSPSRASILTGQYTHNHGVEWNDSAEIEGGYDVYQQNGLDRVSIGYVLQQAGYQTAMVGKFMNGLRPGMRLPVGWDRFVASYTTAYYDFSLIVDGDAVNYRGDAYKT